MAVGIDNLKLVAIACADAVCAADGLANHESVFSLFKYVQDFTNLGAVSGSALKLELADLDPAERKVIDQLIKDRLVLHNTALEAKLEAGVDLTEKVVDYGFKVYATAKEGLGLVAEAKALVGA